MTEVSTRKMSKSTLVSRSVVVQGKKTSIRLEPEMWSALKDVAKRERCTVNNVCTLVDIQKSESTPLTSAIRVFLMMYFKAAATERGHKLARHGCRVIRRVAGASSCEPANQSINNRVESERSRTGS